MQSRLTEWIASQSPGVRLSTVARIGGIVLMTVVLVASTASAGNAILLANTTDDAGSAVDVVFVIDQSDSMDMHRYELAQEMNDLDERMEERGVDARYALLTYEETATTRHSLTSDYGKIDQALNFQTSGNTENASEALTAASELQFRDGAETYVVLFTDEDDDGTETERSQAITNLEDVNFVAVSPADESTSSCEYHSPPCDDDTANELRTISDDVGGDWLDIFSAKEDIVDDIVDSIAPESSSGSSDSSDSTRSSSSSSSSPNIDVEDVTINRTTVEINESFQVNVTLKNWGDADGTFDAELATDAGTIAEDSIDVPERETRNLTIVHSFESPDEYSLYLNYQRIEPITVTPLRDTVVNTSVSDNGTTTTARVSDARENETVVVPINDSALDVSDRTNLSALTLTPTRDADFSLTIETSSDAPNGTNAPNGTAVLNETDVSNETAVPNGTNPLPEDVRPIAFYVLNSTLDEGDIETMTFEFESPSEDVYVYQFDENTSSWTRLEMESVNATNSTNATNASSRTTVNTSVGSIFAIAQHEPRFEITEFDLASDSIRVGESVSTTTTVSNDGLANGTYTVSLTADGSIVDTTNVTVPANESRQVELIYTPNSAGEHVLSTNGEAEASLSVESAPTTTTSSSSETTTSSTTTTTSAPSGQSSLVATPGFGGLIAALAVILGSLFVYRIR